MIVSFFFYSELKIVLRLKNRIVDFDLLIDSINVTIFFACIEGSIGFFELKEGGNFGFILTNRNSPTSLNVDPLSKKLYWVEQSFGFSAHLDGSNITTI